MTVLRIHKKETNFLVLDKTCLTQPGLSWGAKGLHSYLMSLPSDWRINVYDLKNRATNGRDSVRGLLSELENAGYIARETLRNEGGQYGGIEYVVYEIPQNIALSCTKNPAPENPSSVPPCTESPETGFQAPVIPETEKPTLISIKNTKYPEEKIIKAAADNDLAVVENDSEKAAAAFFSQKLPEKTSNLSFINQASPIDSVIGIALTHYQQARLVSLVQTLSDQGFCVTDEEIEYCLLSPKHFKGSGHDFNRKLNAIRTVIVRGEWQMPAEMFLEVQKLKDLPVSFLKADLQNAQATVAHFQWLRNAAKGAARENLDEVLLIEQKKLDEIKAKLKNHQRQ